MSVRPLLPTLLAAALLAAAVPVVHAADDLTPRPQRTFTEKPRIEDYADYNAFLVDIMEFRRQKQEQANRKAAEMAAKAAVVPAAGEAPSLGDNALASVSGQDATQLRELYDIHAPETLEEALDRARKLPHPTYKEAERFGRTTSSSFPIPQMESGDMSSGGVEGLLQDMESLTPEVFRDEGIDLQAEAAVDDNEGADEDDRNTKANLGSLVAYRAMYDLATRYATDSDGKKTWIPIFIDAEVGQTVIRRLDIDVHTLDE